MQFTDAVTVAGTPPVTDENLRACKRALVRFAQHHAVPLPLAVEWTETASAVAFIAMKDGQPFGIAAPKVDRHAVH